MAHEPKKRHSRQRKGKRRAHIELTTVPTVICENCGKFHAPHHLCENCGFYRGKQYMQPTQAKQPSQ